MSKEATNLETGNRCSCDVKVNISGIKLLTIYSSHSFEIANGQTPGDRLVNFTCFNNMGASVVDYLVLSRSLTKNIIKFKVLPPSFDSKHAPVTATFISSFVKFGKGKVLNHSKTYEWDNQGAVLFHSLLNQNDTQEKLGKLRFDLDSSSNTNTIQKAVKQFTEIISECDDKTLRIKKRVKVNTKPKKLWYSENCTLLRKQFTRIAKLLQKDPNNPYIISQYQKIKKCYEHMIKISSDIGR